MTISSYPPTQLWLDVSPAVVDQSWQQSQSFLTSRGRWNAFLNQVCLSTFLPWLQAEYAPLATALPGFWEEVNGTVLLMDTKRLVLIPDKNLETREFYVPQEWVDIPSWAGDYYLAVQVNPDGEWLRIWGYATHEQLKTQGSYDPDQRTYCLDAHQMIEDLNVLWVVRQLNPQEQTQAEIAPLSAITDIQAENLLQRLANPDLANLRLELPFTLWGALLERQEWRQRLLQLRRQDITIAPAARIAKLSNWLYNVFTDTWESVETLLGSHPDLAFSFRQTNEAAVRRVKEINLPSGEAVVLMLTLTTEADDRVGIRVQLHPLERDSYLPENVRLTLLSAAGEVVQSVQAREQDDSIQLKRFKCALNTQFSLQVMLNDFSWREEFVS
jgi:hypothetical protein